MRTRCCQCTIGVFTVLLFLANPSAVYAAYTSTVVGSTATMTGDAANDLLSITESGGLFRHNRSLLDTGFNSDADFDTTVLGDQTVASTTGIININAGDGHDTIALGNGINLRGAIDGGVGVDTISYSTSTAGITANLGLGTTGLSATLGSDQENPPTTHAATGTATVTNYDITTHTFDITVTVTNLLPADVTGFHIHRAVVGVNGPIIVDFTGVAPLVPTGTGFTFTATGLLLPSADEAAFLGGGTYVNIHTAAFPGGAVRGQLFSGGNVDLGAGWATGTTGIANFEGALGGSGADSLVGNFTANLIDGSGGADWIAGGPANDTLIGGAGADVLVWSNGDGSDTDEGGADGDTVHVNGSVSSADFFVVSANGTRLALDRANVGQFNLDIGTVETLIVNGIGGNDTFNVNDLTGVASLTTLNLNGFEGNEDYVYVPSSAGAVTFNAHAGTGDGDTLTGPNVANTWNVTAPNQGNITSLVTFRFVELLIGGTASDLFNAKAFASGTPALRGGDGADTLSYDAESRVVSGDTTPPDGVIDSPGVQSLTFTQMETVSIINASNTAPTISAIANQTIPANGNTGAIAFTVGDLESPAGVLVVSASSSNTVLVPDANIALAGAGASRTVTVTPAINQVGTATITVTVSDGSLSASTAFILSVAGPTTVQPPTDLYVSAMSGNVVTFRFKSPLLGPPPTEFVLEGGINPGQVLAGIPTGSDTPIFSVVAPRGSFFVRMHATRGADKSAASNEIRVHVDVPVAPSAPDLFSTATNGNGVVLAWRNTFGGGAPASLVLDVTGSVVAQIPLDLTETIAVTNVPGGTYTLRLQAVNGGGVSSASAPTTLTVPSPCSGPPETPSSFLGYRLGDTANVVWEPPASGPAAESFILNISGALNFSFPTTLRALGGQAPPGSYTVSVVAVNPCGASPATTPQTIVVP